MHIMSASGYKRLYNYINDLVYIGLPANIYYAYACLLNVLLELGLDISKEKLVTPTTLLICLDI